MDLTVRWRVTRLWMLLIVVAAAAVWLTGCPKATPVAAPGGSQAVPVRPKAPAAKPAQKPAQKPAVKPSIKAEFENAKITWPDAKGQRMWDAKFKGAVLLQSGTGSTVQLRTVRATLYRNGKPASILVAPLVVADGKTKVVRAEGGVRVTSLIKNAAARCRTLVWNSKADKIVGTGDVEMRQGNITVTSKSFQSDTALNRAVFQDGQLSLR